MIFKYERLLLAMMLIELGASIVARSTELTEGNSIKDLSHIF